MRPAGWRSGLSQAGLRQLGTIPFVIYVTSAMASTGAGQSRRGT
jgi:hypothetical protein